MSNHPRQYLPFHKGLELLTSVRAVPKRGNTEEAWAISVRTCVTFCCDVDKYPWSSWTGVVSKWILGSISQMSFPPPSRQYISFGRGISNEYQPPQGIISPSGRSGHYPGPEASPKFWSLRHELNMGFPKCRTLEENSWKVQREMKYKWTVPKKEGDKKHQGSVRTR